MSELTNIATLRARPGKSEQLGAALAALVVPTRAESGCLMYVLHRAANDGDVWMVYERWANQAACDAHLSQPHVQAFLPRLSELVLGDIAVQTYTPA